jgi:serine/threonine-protein kinase
VLVSTDAERDTIKIVDFGLAKIADEATGASEMTTMGRVVGTPAYLSPEQASGQAVGPPSDIYSLGVILYHARAGRKPFEGTTLALLARHIGEMPAPLGDEPVDRLIMSLLVKRPGDRPDAATLVARFAALADDGLRFVVSAPARGDADATASLGPERES